MVGPLESRFATLERGGDAGRGRGLSTGALERGGNRPAVRGERGRAALCAWAACWVSLSPFLSSRLEGGRGPSWAQSPNMCLRFLGWS